MIVSTLALTYVGIAFSSASDQSTLHFQIREKHLRPSTVREEGKELSAAEKKN